MCKTANFVQWLLKNSNFVKGSLKNLPYLLSSKDCVQNATFSKEHEEKRNSSKYCTGKAKFVTRSWKNLVWNLSKDRRKKHEFSKRIVEKARISSKLLHWDKRLKPDSIYYCRKFTAKHETKLNFKKNSKIVKLAPRYVTSDIKIPSCRIVLLCEHRSSLFTKQFAQRQKSMVIIIHIAFNLKHLYV